MPPLSKVIPKGSMSPPLSLAGAWVYPTIGPGGAGWVSGAPVTPGAGPGAFGGYSDVIPAGWATAAFALFAVNVEVPYLPLPVNQVSYELVIASGAPGSEVEQARVRFTRSVTEEIVNGLPICTIALPAGTRVRAMVAASAPGAPPIAVSLEGFYV